MRRDLQDLEALTRMVLDAELAKLRAASTEVAAHRAKIAALNAEVAIRAQSVKAAAEGLDLASSLGQDARWLSWVMQKKKELNAEMSRAAAALEAQQQKAKHAFGRVEAVSGLRQKERDAQRVTEARRVQFDSISD